jgi:hypothetical protein
MNLSLSDMLYYFGCGLGAGILLKLMVELVYYAVNSLLGIFRNILH